MRTSNVLACGSCGRQLDASEIEHSALGPRCFRCGLADQISKHESGGDSPPVDRRKPSWWLYPLHATVGAVVGVAVGTVLGLLPSLIHPRQSGCGDIGCWDFLVGMIIGGFIGLLVGPTVAVWRLLRRRARL